MSFIWSVSQFLTLQHEGTLSGDRNRFVYIYSCLNIYIPNILELKWNTIYCWWHNWYTNRIYRTIYIRKTIQGSIKIAGILFLIIPLIKINAGILIAGVKSIFKIEKLTPTRINNLGDFFPGGKLSLWGCPFVHSFPRVYVCPSFQPIVRSIIQYYLRGKKLSLHRI